MGGDACELAIVVDRKGAESLTVKLSHGKDGEHATTIRYDGREIEIAGRKVALTLGENEPLQLNVFVDRSVMEVFANSRVCVSRVVPNGLSREVTVSASSGNAQLKSIESWGMETIWKN